MAIITLCGSGKFRDLVHGIAQRLINRGMVVLAPPLHDISVLAKGAEPEGVLLAWKGATHAHLKRIATSNVCVIVNPGGYLGASSTMEMGYAVALQKLVIALAHDSELAREALFDIVLETENEEDAAERIYDIVTSI